MDPNTGNTLANRRLRALLFDTASVSTKTIDDTFERIQHFASLTGGQDLVIVFLLNPPRDSSFISAKELAKASHDGIAQQDAIRAYSKIQAEMVNRPEIPYIPILPTSTLEGLSNILEKYIARVTSKTPEPKASTTPFALLQQCTANQPMSDQTAYNLTDIFSNLKDLAAACTSVSSAPNSSSPSARAASTQVSSINEFGTEFGTQSSDITAASKLKELRGLIGQQECQDIIDFWKEEWTVQ